MSLDLIAFVVNYCQTADLGIEYGVGARDGLYHSFSPGARFVRTFVDPDSRLSALQHVLLGLNRSFNHQPVDLALQYHTRHLSLRDATWDQDAYFEKPRVLLHRQQAMIRGEHDVAVPLLERVSSVSLTILNTKDAPYSIVVLLDDAMRFLMSMDRNLAYGFVDKAGNGVFPDARVLQGDGPDGLRPAGRCAGLTQFMRMILAVLARWEEEWLRALRAIDRAADFQCRDLASWDIRSATRPLTP
ncbi:uncharacterized protein THITE_2132353 [Thermothielavioides terrestris NRRL 8126]|uniref:Uncharacterized protein n=1 Tax=Thermothielavioides terrestris (strain ATCC 38088 / NRRL 8126) TaxID=578455 RepID=G2REB6_THETT|nr:uncharacterized protein THITE_2132353 [Thermothielavioides terrestris NRRL 8126]AEO70945.1 hypothetical protein THITE_2132353 [Thermothielavioides terrestris NRRL 8126]